MTRTGHCLCRQGSWASRFVMATCGCTLLPAVLSRLCQLLRHQVGLLPPLGLEWALRPSFCRASFCPTSGPGPTGLARAGVGRPGHPPRRVQVGAPGGSRGPSWPHQGPVCPRVLRQPPDMRVQGGLALLPQVSSCWSLSHLSPLCTDVTVCPTDGPWLRFVSTFQDRVCGCLWEGVGFLVHENGVTCCSAWACGALECCSASSRPRRGLHFVSGSRPLVGSPAPRAEQPLQLFLHGESLPVERPHPEANSSFCKSGPSICHGARPQAGARACPSEQGPCQVDSEECRVADAGAQMGG